MNWIFCNVGFVEVPLVGIDSINLENGTCDDDSVLSIVVFGVSIVLMISRFGIFGKTLTNHFIEI